MRETPNQTILIGCNSEISDSCHDGRQIFQFATLNKELTNALKTCRTLVRCEDVTWFDDNEIKTLAPGLDLILTNFPIDDERLVYYKEHCSRASMSIEVVPNVALMGALRAFEHFRLSNLATKRAVFGKINSAPKVAIIGAGIIGLVTAWFLNRRGIQGQIFEKSPDPRKPECTASLLGATFGGGNARVFSFNESRNHLIRETDGNASIQDFFRRSIEDGGWSMVARPNDNEQTWLDLHTRVPNYLAKVHDEDVITINKSAGPLWEFMRQADPKHFIRSNYVDGLLRLYSTSPQYIKALQKDAAIGSIIHQLSLDELFKLEPSLGPALGKR
jgi:hypothetical protein